MSRLQARFAQLARENRAGLVTFVMANDPDLATSRAILAGLPAAGADIVELGMPFSDPMADGPAIQLAGGRALKSGGSLAATLDLAAEFRRGDGATPLVLMGYYNPIYRMGAKAFAGRARDAGVDGVIVVDLPPEEDGEFRPHAEAAGVDLIRLATPTSDDARLARIVAGASGFIYYVAVLGVTGTKAATSEQVERAVTRLRARTQLPIAVGFGIRTPTQAAAVARAADAAVVGSALVGLVGECEARGARGEAPAKLHGLVRELAQAVRAARQMAKA